MKRIVIRRPAFSAKTAIKYLLLAAAMLLCSYALPQREPLSFALFFAALAEGLNPFLAGAGFLLSSLSALSWEATLSNAAAGAFLVLVFCIYRRFRRRPSYERILYALIAQLPFVFLFPHGGYALFPFGVLWQKAVIAVFLVLCSLLFEGGLHALLHQAFRCRMGAGSLAELCLIWIFLGLGILNAFSSFGEAAFFALSLTLLLLAVVLAENAAAVPFSVVLALPLAIARTSALPVAAFALLSTISLLFLPYGKIAAAMSLAVCFLGGQYFEGLYQGTVAQIVLTVLACLLPALALSCIPERYIRRARKTLLFYRERALPRIAINRNRRAVGERLYEVSSLFREIETAFNAEEREDDSGRLMCEQLENTLCAGCQNRNRCAQDGIYESMAKLVAVGRAKGRVNLIDLPADISSACSNSAGMLFALNKQLAEYRRYARDLESAREGRQLLARQAHGISEILKDIALEQSEEYVFSDGEKSISSALAAAGILSYEIFVYGEGNGLTASMTLDAATDGKKLCAAAGKAMGIPLALSEKIPLTNDRACFVLKRKPEFDAAFGIASLPKAGESASGDTHSILKIDERRFLVALSDGMGSGEEARTVSDHTLSLLESFYKAKMPSETVLSTVNQLIAFSTEESFSCLDLAAVDLDTGNADIVKIGSPAGFILAEGELRILEGESLPIGIMEAVHPATMKVSLKENDFLLFMSDGVTTAFGSSSELCAFLSGLSPVNPQSLAEEVLDSALQRYRGKAEDDMTVLAVKLTKAA